MNSRSVQRLRPYRRSRRRDKRKGQNRGIIALLAAFLTLTVVSMVGMGVYLLHTQQAEDEFRELALWINREGSADASQQEETMVELPAIRQDPVTGEMTEDAENPVTILSQYAELYRRNPDLFGWLYIEGTRIDYPVMHSPREPEKYLHRSFSQKYSYAGTPFLDAACTQTSDNYMVYGHNMRTGTMFRDLMRYEKESYWQEHPVIRFDTLQGRGEYEVVAAFYDRIYRKDADVFKFYHFLDAENEQDFDAAMEQFRRKALYDTGVDASYGDQLLTLVTCAYHTDDGRFVVVARRKN